MTTRRATLGEGIGAVAAFLFVALVSGITLGLTGAVAITVIRWLTGWPA